MDALSRIYASRKTHETFSSLRFGTQAVITLRCSWGDGLVHSNSRLHLRAELMASRFRAWKFTSPRSKKGSWTFLYGWLGTLLHLPPCILHERTRFPNFKTFAIFFTCSFSINRPGALLIFHTTIIKKARAALVLPNFVSPNFKFTFLYKYIKNLDNGNIKNKKKVKKDKIEKKVRWTRA